MKDERALLDTLSAALAEAPIALALDGASPTGQRFPSRSLATMVLALLVGGHLAVVLTILVNEAVFWRMIDAGQRYFLIGHPKPWVISLLVGGFFGLFALHTFIALRKLPWPAGPARTLTAWAQHLRHPDTALWLSQLITGFALSSSALLICTPWWPPHRWRAPNSRRSLWEAPTSGHCFWCCSSGWSSMAAWVFIAGPLPNGAIPQLPMVPPGPSFACAAGSPPSL